MISATATPTSEGGGRDAKLTDPTPPLKKATRACTGCHKAKCKCTFSKQDQSKCDRCFRLNRDCVPHLSRQGKRKNDKALTGSSVATFGDGNNRSSEGATSNTSRHRSIETMEMLPSELNNSFMLGLGYISAPSRDDVNSMTLNAESFASGIIGYSAGGNARTSHHQFMGTVESWFGANGIPASPSNQTQTLMQNTTSSYASACQNLASWLPSSPYGSNRNRDPQSSLIQNPAELSGVDEMTQINSQTDVTVTPSPALARGHNTTSISSTTQHSITHKIDLAQQKGPGMNNLSLPLSIPLREWMHSALDSTGTGVYSHNTPIPPDYLTSCLRIALSLSKQISDAEENSNEFLRSLPSDIAQWVGSVTVKLKPKESVFPGERDVRNEASDDASSANSELNKLETLFDSICEEDEIDSAAFPDSYVDSAEIFIDDCFRSTTIDSDKIDLDTSLGRSQRIYSLALVFCEMFTGGRLPDCTAALSSDAFDTTLHPVKNNDQGFISEGLERLDFASMVKLDDDADQVNDGSARKKMPKPHASLNFSLDFLKRCGLPYRLCDLLYDMLDCINGDLSGEESYKEMSEVAADLQLMIDEPSLFLHDLDVVTLSSSSLQLDDNLFMRDAEFQSLQHAYLRSISGSSVLAIISGGSGTGKSHLASQLGRYITSNGGIFLSVKFNQLKEANPISDIVSAFNEYCNIFTTMKDSKQMNSMASQLRDALGQDAHNLIKLIPKLSEILICDTTDPSPNYDCVHGQEKILYLLIRFVEVMSDCSNMTLTLFLDDLQWADAFSLSVLQQMIMMPNEDKRFFFLGCYRDDEIDDDHPFKKMLDKFIENGIPLTMIRLDCMTKEKLQRMVSTLLHLSPRLLKGLSDIIYHKTKGNPLFVSRLLLSLNRDGLLNLSLNRRRWVWDESLIKSTELPTDVATFFSRVISMLSTEVQSALQVLSCFGSAESCELSILETKLGLNLVKPLESAVDEGFVSKNDDKYRFSHDQIQEAAYIMVPLEYRCLEHLQYGLCLVEVSAEKENECLLFTALGQINLAGPSVVPDVTLSIEIARHNLVAGKKAIAMSEFSCAARFFNSGISFLKENYWRDHYRLTLELFGLAAKCSLVTGDFTCLDAMSKEIDKHAHCLDDKLDNLFVVMSSYANTSKISDSIQLGLSILTQLGCELPTTSTQRSTMALIKHTQQDLSTLPDNVLLNYKKMTNSRHIMAMKCLAKLEFPTLQISPELQPIVNLKMVDMTINYGMCDSSPVGFAYFASMLTRCGEMHDGYRFAKLAKTLLHQVGSKEMLGDDFDCFGSGCIHLSLDCIRTHAESLLSIFCRRCHLYYHRSDFFF